MNLSGLAAAAATFFGVWFGHVAVRKIEFVSDRLWHAALVFILTGLGFEAAALASASAPLSIAFGIFGITLMWDALELVRQDRRVRNGHAPANPNNPRHEQILRECPAATTVDVLKRE